MSIGLGDFVSALCDYRSPVWTLVRLQEKFQIAQCVQQLLNFWMKVHWSYAWWIALTTW